MAKEKDINFHQVPARSSYIQTPIGYVEQWVPLLTDRVLIVQNKFPDRSANGIE